MKHEMNETGSKLVNKNLNNSDFLNENQSAVY